MELFSMSNPAMIDQLYDQYKEKLKSQMEPNMTGPYVIKTKFHRKYTDDFENLYQHIKQRWISEGLMCIEYEHKPHYTKLYVICVP